MTKVNSAPPVQPNNNYRKPDYKGALATAGVGSVAWGVGEYFFKKTPFIDDKSNLSDSFVRSIKEGLENLKDPKYLNLKKQLEKLNCKIDKCTSAEDLNNFFRNNICTAKCIQKAVFIHVFQKNSV
jgi:hypothetical protein